jgi:hypothetical protein
MLPHQTEERERRKGINMRELEHNYRKIWHNYGSAK